MGDKSNGGKFTLAVDGHWWWMVKMATCRPGKPPSFMEDRARDEGMLWEKLSMDFARELRDLRPCLDNVIFVTDCRSWRKKHVYKTAPWKERAGESAGMDYKAARVRDNTIDWAAAFSSFMKWLGHLKQHYGISHISAEGAEGDDLIWSLGRHCNGINKNFMFLSADKDLIQLIGVHPNKSMRAYFYRKRGCKANNFTPQRALYADGHLENALLSASRAAGGESIFDFSMSGQANNPFAHLLDNAVDVILRERPDSFIFERITVGDAGDGIPPVILNDSSPKRNKKPTVKMMSAILKKEYNITKERPINRSLLYDDGFINNYTYKLFCALWKKEPTAEEHDFAIARFKENRMLGVLNEKEIPIKVQDNMRDAINGIDFNAAPRLSAINSAMDIMRSAGKIPNGNFFKSFEKEINK